MLIGTTLVMASSCVFNNYLDRDYDGLMERTSHRPLPSGRIHPKKVFIFASILGAVGLFVLFFFTNALAGWLRNCRYDRIRHYIYGLAKENLNIKYCNWIVLWVLCLQLSVILLYTGTMDAGAWILFGFLFLWQCPHFWALGIRRIEEYRAAGFQILPVVKGVKRTKIQMIPYVVLLIPVSLLLYLHGLCRNLLLCYGLVLGILWLLLCLAGFFTKDDNRWAKRTFMFSIYYLLIVLIVMILDTTRFN